MRRSAKPANSRRGPFRRWLRRGHRWLGLAAVAFVLVLSASGIALNHSSDWRLDRRYVRWDWATSALGIRAPDPTVSYADRGHRVTQLGRRAYFDATEIPHAVESLAGFVMLQQLAVVATADAILLLTEDGEFVEMIDLAAGLPAAVARIGRAGERPVLESGGRLFIGDAEVTAFAPLPGTDEAGITWSTASAPAPAEFEVLKNLYRGRGVTIERLLLEIHSGRIVAGAGPVLLDLVAVGLIVLSLSGVFVWLWGGRGNGRQGRRQ